MSLTVEDFFDDFAKAELKEVQLESKGGRTIFLRALPYAKVWQFRVLATKIARARALDVVSGSKDEENWEADKVRAEDYLIEEAMANHDGTKFFSDKSQFARWRDNVQNNVVNEILFHIDEMNVLDDSFKPDQVTQELKRKKK